MNTARYIEVRAGVRYWDDAQVNGEVDVDGKIPLRVGDEWQLTIDLATGRILDWPQGVRAETCYKVCDEGLYWLLDASRQRIAKWKRSYVPAEFLDIEDGSGLVSDYIVLSVGNDGVIKDWRAPAVDAEQWIPV
jgi:hypothetical protein